MVGGRPTVDLPLVVRARIEARTGDVVFVVPDFRISPETTVVDPYPPSHGHPRDVPFYEAGSVVWPGRGFKDRWQLLVSVEERGGQRP